MVEVAPQRRGLPKTKGGKMGTRRTQTRAARVFAAGAVVAMTLSGCTTDPVFPTPTVHDQVIINFSYWGEPGIFDAETGSSLEEQYESIRPWVDIVPVAMEYTAHHDRLFQSLALGSGAPNVVMLDEGYIIHAVDNSDGFVNLLDLGAGQYEDDYLPWKWQEAASADGSVVVGLGADGGGLALCYRKDLFEAAGLPSDREDVSAAVGDSWDDFIAFGQEYEEATRKYFVDNATNVLNPAIWQLGTGHAYYDRDDELDMDNIKPAFDTALDVIDAGISAGIGAWSPEWNAGFTNGDFAVLPCPAWMLGYIQNQIDEDTFDGQWDVADIPGPGGNWGGSFFTIPKQGTAYEQQEAYHFVEWLIQPEQQMKTMAETGNLPSQTALLQSDEIATLTNEFFNDAPYGEIYAKTVLDIPGPVYHSRCGGVVRTVVETVLNDIQHSMLDGERSRWDNTVDFARAADECSGVDG
jgi:cellobiose transport system substrate-binding protein